MNNTLPDDIEQLKALLIAQQAVIVRLSGEITGYAREISSLRALVAKLQRMLFGRSCEKSREKIEKKIARAETRITELQNRLGEAQLQLTSMAGETAPKTSDSPVCKGIHPQQHLADYRGILQADAYAGYNALYESGQVTEAACMAHARRKIHDVHVRHPTKVTGEALRRIGALYAIESELRGSPAEERLAVRKARTVPLMQSLYEWLQGQMSTLSRHSDTATAFAYLLKTVRCTERVLRRLGGNQQQHLRKRLTGSGRRAEELTLRGDRQCWRTCGGAVLADRYMPSEQCGTGKMAALRH